MKNTWLVNSCFLGLVFAISLTFFLGERVNAAENEVDFDQQTITVTLLEKGTKNPGTTDSGSSVNGQQVTNTKPSGGIFPSTGEMNVFWTTFSGVLLLGLLVLVWFFGKRRKAR
ncbi:LPXTG cell wall anchor domain-containing protein [Enterococcus sp. LJL99]